VLGAAAFQTARVAADQAVLDGGGEDGFQQPVGLGRGDRADAVGDQVGAPAAYISVSDRSDSCKANDPGTGAPRTTTSKSYNNKESSSDT
jgi:hypothetical protein